MLSQGRPALTTGLDEAWYLDHGTDNKIQKHPLQPTLTGGA